MIHRGIIKVNGINIFYHDTKSDGKTILCLHGRWGRGSTWTDFINIYKDKYRIIAPDQRGHGLSDKPNRKYSAEILARDAFELIKYLSCDPVIAIGHSMGGRVAAYLSVHHPEVVSALAILDENAEGDDKQLRGNSVDPFDDGLTFNWPTPFPTYSEALRYLRLRYKLESNVKYFLESLIETVDGYDFMFSRKAMASIGRSYKSWYHLLPKIKCPTLLVRASESWCLLRDDADKMRKLIKDCTYFEVSNSDHMIYADNPNSFYQQFEAFLNRL
jgi:pimeloyl-ACP methyl ester carboxylesterase